MNFSLLELSIYVDSFIAAGMSSMVGLPSDRALVEDDECLRSVNISFMKNSSFSSVVNHHDPFSFMFQCSN